MKRFSFPLIEVTPMLLSHWMSCKLFESTNEQEKLIDRQLQINASWFTLQNEWKKS